MNQLTLKARLT